MYEVRVQGRFSAVHQLRLYDSTLEALHGHDWKVEAVFRGPQLDTIGVLIDFTAASAALEQVLAELQYADLNRAALLKGANPTTELVARIIFENLRERLGSSSPLWAVYVEEAPGCIAGFLSESS